MRDMSLNILIDHPHPTNRLSRRAREKYISEIDRANQRHKKHRADAREAARRSEDPAVRTALLMAEAGFGVVDIITKTSVDASLVRLLVLGTS